MCIFVFVNVYMNKTVKCLITSTRRHNSKTRKRQLFKGKNDQKIIVADLNKRWNLAIKMAQTFDRNGVIRDFHGHLRAEKEVAKVAQQYQCAVEKLKQLKRKIG